MITAKKLLNSLAVLGLIASVSQAQGSCEEAPFGERTFTICKVWPA